MQMLEATFPFVHWNFQERRTTYANQLEVGAESKMGMTGSNSSAYKEIQSRDTLKMENTVSVYNYLKNVTDSINTCFQNNFGAAADSSHASEQTVRWRKLIVSPHISC